MKSFSSRLIALRRERDMTQADLAKAIAKNALDRFGLRDRGERARL